MKVLDDFKIGKIEQINSFARTILIVLVCAIFKACQRQNNSKALFRDILKYCIFFIVMLFGQPGITQSDSVWKQNPTINFTGFIDIFYAYDFNKPQTDFRQPFFYNHNRHNEFNLNLGFLKLALEHTKYRANIALHTGTYANDNYTSEPGLLKNIFESNIGLSLNKKNNLWLDVGIFGSPIGFESAISIHNWTLTRSLVAENSPYYLSGAKLTFNPGEKWEIAALICNGWQRIQRVSGNSLPSFCTQVQYKPTEKTTLNWSTFIGTNDPDSTRRMRYFNNVYGQFQINNKFGLIAGFDIGMQQRIINSSQYNLWLGPVMIVRYAFTDEWATALRAEYYLDETGVIVSTGTGNGFNTSGLSVNLDYSPTSNFFCRLEGRWLNSRDKIFQQADNFSNNNIFIVTSIALSINK